MSRRSFICMMHTADIYTKVKTSNDMGQLVASWNRSIADQRCFATPSGSKATNRVVPTSEQRDWVTLIFPHDVDINLDTRIDNIRLKRNGELIYAGPFEVDQVDKAISFSGAVQYVQVTAKSVIE